MLVIEDATMYADKAYTVITTTIVFHQESVVSCYHLIYLSIYPHYSYRIQLLSFLLICIKQDSLMN